MMQVCYDKANSMIPPSSLSIVIQAGGQSRRMGRDKALLDFHGQPLIQRVVERVRLLADEMLITAAEPASYAFLGLPCVADLLPGKGALGGLYTALSLANAPLVAVVACDMPFVNAELLAYQRDVLLEGNCDAAVPQTDAGIEPFHAVYRRETMSPLAEAALHGERLSIRSCLEKANVRWVSSDEIGRFDPQGMAFWNVNTPEEYLRALEKSD
jgi:molybdopterin-guanine dinucleotide biosynthesis protein A